MSQTLQPHQCLVSLQSKELQHAHSNTDTALSILISLLMQGGIILLMEILKKTGGLFLHLLVQATSLLENKFVTVLLTG